MLATRIAGRVLSRMASFAVKGALVMAIAGAFEGCVFGIALNFMRYFPQLRNASGSQTGAMIMMPSGFFTGFFVFAFAGALTSRRNEVHVVFAKVYRSAIVGSFFGALICALCFASLFALLTWVTNGNFLPVPTRTFYLPVEYIQVSTFVGYLIGVGVGFFLGTLCGVLYATSRITKSESSTRTETY